MGKMKTKMKKKGIFFTMIAITMMALFILVFAPQEDESLQKGKNSGIIRANIINDYAIDLETAYFESALRASTYKTLLSLAYYMNSTGNYISDLDAAFYEVALNGTINNVPIDSITGKKIMENSTLANFSRRIEQVAKDTLNVDTTIRIQEMTIYQSKPWEVSSTILLNLSIHSDVAEWNSSATISSSTSIEGLPDPYYLVNTRATSSYTNQIKRSSLSTNQWNISNTRVHLRNATYVHWQDSSAPSFLMRFTNTLSNSSCCGIESLVNPNNIVPSDQTESYVDYLFWSHKFNSNCTQLFNITGLWDEFMHFKLDFDHVVKYNITSSDAVDNC